MSHVPQVPPVHYDRPLLYSSPLNLEERQDGYLRASVDSGATWWVHGPRLDAAAAPGFGYSGLVELGGGDAASWEWDVGVVYEPAGGGVAFQVVAVDLSSLRPQLPAGGTGHDSEL